MKKDSLEIRKTTGHGAILIDKIIDLVSIAYAEKLLLRFWQATNNDERHLILQHIAQKAKCISEKELDNLTRNMLLSGDNRLRGEMCYALGLSGKVKFESKLHSMLTDPNPWVRNQASDALERLPFGEREKTMFEPLKKEEIIQKMFNQSNLQTNDYSDTILNEFEKNRKAYEKKEKSLLEKYRGKYVALCNGKLVAVGPNRKQVIEEAIEKEPTSRPYIRKVGQKIPSIPSGRP